METWSREQWETAIRKSEIALYYLYTPICGTCAVASKMMDVVEAYETRYADGKSRFELCARYCDRLSNRKCSVSSYYKRWGC